MVVGLPHPAGRPLSDAGTTSGPLLAAVVLAVALLAWPRPESLALQRLGGLGRRRAPGPTAPSLRRLATGPVRRWALAVCAAIPVAALLGGVLGAAVGVGVLVGAERALRRREGSDQSRAAALAAELPGACDLLAVVLAAGVPLPVALGSVGAAVPGPLGAELARVAGLCRLGADPRRAWQDVPMEVEPLARVLRRSELSGARAAPALTDLAAEARAAARATVDLAVRRAGVAVLAPLGLCFLPAFVCLGVVPLVMGLAGDVLG